jgi:hypothetical protein
VFCPNCGTQNPDAAQTCSKCNFHLKSVAAPKFKGTMLMMNQPGVVPVGPAQPNTQRAGSGVAPSTTPPPPGAGAGAPQAPNRLKGTMVGVAPMGGGPLGGPPMGGPPRGMNAPVAVPQPGGFPMPPPGAPQGMPQQAPRTPPPPGMPEMGAYSPPVPQGGVNPLGGTVAADASSFNQAFGGPKPGMPYGAPVPQGTALMPGGMGAPGMGAPPPYGASPYGAPPQQAGSGAPPPYDPGMAANPYGGPPPNPNPFAGPPPGYSSGPPGGQIATPPPQAMMPYGQPGPGGSGAPGMGSAAIVPAKSGSEGLLYGVLPGSTSAPVRRNAPMAILIPVGLWVAASILGFILALTPLRGLVFLAQLVSLAGTIWVLLQAITMANEVKAVTRNDSFAWWPIFVPIYNWYWLWILVPQEVAKAKQLLGVQRPTRSFVVYFFLWPYALAADINDMVR